METREALDGGLPPLQPTHSSSTESSGTSSSARLGITVGVVPTSQASTISSSSSLGYSATYGSSHSYPGLTPPSTLAPLNFSASSSSLTVNSTAWSSSSSYSQRSTYSGRDNSAGGLQGSYRLGSSGNNSLHESLYDDDAHVSDVFLDPVTGLPAISLLNFDHHAPSVTLTSPRSIEACERLGILPSDLLARPATYFEEQLEAQRMRGEKIEPSMIRPFAQAKFHHYEKKRQADLRACREERAKVVKERMAVTEDPEAAAIRRAKNAKMIEREQRRLEKMQQLQVKQLNALVASEVRRCKLAAQAHENVRSRVLAEEQMRLNLLSDLNEKLANGTVLASSAVRVPPPFVERLHDGDSEARSLAVLQEVQRERKAFEMQIAAAEKTAARERHLQAVDEGRALKEARRLEEERQLQLKEKQRSSVLEELRTRTMEDARRRGSDRDRRIMAARQAQASLVIQRAEETSERERKAEARKWAFEEQMRLAREEARLKAQRKEEKIRQAKLASQAKIEEMAKSIMDKEAARLERLNRAPTEEELAKMKAIELNDAVRQLKYAEEQKLLQSKKEDARAANAERQERAEEMRAEVLRQRAEAAARKKREAALLIEDRAQHVQRMQRIKDYQRRRLLEKQRLESHRMEMVEQQYKNLAEQREMLRRQGQAQLQRATALVARIRTMNSSTIVGLDIKEHTRQLLEMNDPSREQQRTSQRDSLQSLGQHPQHLHQQQHRHQQQHYSYHPHHATQGDDWYDQHQHMEGKHGYERPYDQYDRVQVTPSSAADSNAHHDEEHDHNYQGNNPESDGQTSQNNHYIQQGS